MHRKKTQTAFEAMMKETPYAKYDSGYDGILPECRTCRFHRPFWKYQSCAFEACPYSAEHLSTEIMQQPGQADRKGFNNG